MSGSAITDEAAGDERFQEEVRAFIAHRFPAELKGRGNAPANVEGPIRETAAEKSWREAMGERGWGVPRWPRVYGGGGLSGEQASILAAELSRAGAYNPIGGVGVIMLGPTLLEFGSEDQKREHLPPIARGEIRWCQGYSEPGAGSDLASLQTFAEDRGDHYVVNGQKTWTSGGQWADKCFAIVRTDKSQKHGGISFLLIDMKSPGVEVRPIQLISGRSSFCETFLTNVNVPKKNLVGREGQGWTIGKRLLQHERTNISSGGAMARLMPGKLSDIARRYVALDDGGGIADRVLRDRIADFEIRWHSFELTAQRARAESEATGGVSEVSSVLKKLGTKLGQERSELLIEILGLQGLGWEGDGFDEGELAGVRGWLFVKATTIYGGSTEIQNNIIAKRVLGMPDR